MEETKKLKPLSVIEILAACRTVRRWMSSAQSWGDRDPVALNKMALSSAYWFGRIEKEDQVLLIAVKIEEATQLIEMLLTSMPESAELQVWKAFQGWIETNARRRMAGMTPRQQERAKAAVKVELATIMDRLSKPPH